jgi:NTP pyrophosphatase (non-canonical NTP hydrolase)
MWRVKRFGEDQVTHSTRQRELFQACRDAQWDPDDKNTFAEEIAHLHEEVSEAFQAFRQYGDAKMGYTDDGKPEFADVLIGLYYNAERMGFDLDTAVEIKMRYNRQRNYVKEGRQLHA